MNALQPINMVAASTGISSRTLRYWEDSGLFSSTRDRQSGWRLYDDHALQCIRITDLLRRLDIPIKDIRKVILSQSVDSVRNVLKKQLTRLNKMNADLQVRKEAISALIRMLQTELPLTLPVLESMLQPVALERQKYTITSLGKGLDMENMKSKYGEVQFINLPPMRTVAYSCVGAEPEEKAMAPVIKWVTENNLRGTMRLFGFNTNPYPTENSLEYGFGYCASIPEGVEIPEHLFEMRLPGGVYAVISQYEGDPSYGWKKAQALLQDSEWEWEYDCDRHPGLEEHIERAGEKGGYFIPILFPVRKKR